MTIEQIDDLLINNNLDKVKEILQLNYDVEVIKTALKQYDPAQHDVFDKALRPDKPLYKDTGRVDTNGDPIMEYEGFKKVHRIAVPFQKQIVLLRSAFIGNPKMQAQAENELQTKCLTILQKIWDDNKMDYRFAETTKRTMSELRCAWLWYNVKEEGYWEGQPITSNIHPKMKVLSHELGDTLYPVYDDSGDLIAFGRAYTTVLYDENYNKTTIEHLDIYTAERFYFKKREKGFWYDNYSVDDVIVSLKDNEGNATSSYMENIVGKIPITYFHQPLPEWQDVQDACNRIDEVLSTHAETNEYFGNPILVGIVDETISLPQKGDAGKYVELKGKGDLKFVTWDNAPESIKMELLNLYNIVYDLSNTPNVSFEQMKGLGPMSGFAIKLLFLASSLKAKDCEMTVFGEGVQRAYNYLKKLISVLDKTYVKTLSFHITPVFASILPSDETEQLNKIVSAINGGVMSIETGITLNPLVEDAEAEKLLIEKEKEAVAPIKLNGNAFGQNNGNGIVKDDVLKEPASV